MFTTMFEATPDFDNSEKLGDSLADLMDLSDEELENVALLGLIAIRMDNQNIIATNTHLEGDDTLDASPKLLTG